MENSILPAGILPFSNLQVLDSLNALLVENTTDSNDWQNENEKSFQHQQYNK